MLFCLPCGASKQGINKIEILLAHNLLINVNINSKGNKGDEIHEIGKEISDFNINYCL